MSDRPVEIEQITGNPRSVSQLFTQRRYRLGYYQREYAWTTANVDALVEDLTAHFLDEYDPGHPRERVAFYRPYFLGPIVTHSRGDALDLVDGQQRLTSLQLLLIHLSHVVEDGDLAGDLRALIRTRRFGRDTFTMDVTDREQVMKAFLDGRDPQVDSADETGTRLVGRYADLQAAIADAMSGRSLVSFCDWLLERVVVVEIATGDEGLALDIFQSMNDRGLRLTSSDMLKGYLLSHIGAFEATDRAHRVWRDSISALRADDATADADFFKSWLRGGYAQTIRERVRAAQPGDFDDIGSAFHQWVRRNTDVVGLKTPDDFRDLIEHDVARLSGRYLQVLDAQTHLRPDLTPLYGLGWLGFTLHHMLVLAAVTADDDEGAFTAKVRLVTGYVDRQLALRMVNSKQIGYSTLSYTMFQLAKDLRGLPVDELAEVLSESLAGEDLTFEAVGWYSLNQRNKSHMRYVLSRITAWLDATAHRGDRTLADYLGPDRSDPYEIEHLLGGGLGNHEYLVETEEQFQQERNRLGALVLLPKSFNASFGGRTYDEKLPHYLRQNLLTASLHPDSVTADPRFRQVRDAHGLDFAAMDEVTLEGIAARTQLYRRLCELTWDPTSMGLASTAEDRPSAQDVGPAHFGVSVRDLLVAGLLSPGAALHGVHRGVTHVATLDADGRIRLDDGSTHASPSRAGMVALNRRSLNGWTFWKVRHDDGTEATLAQLRDGHLRARRS